MHDQKFLNEVEQSLIDVVHKISEAKFAQAMTHACYCGSHELRDTITDMTSTSYQDRLKAEHDQLLIRIIKLENFLEKYKNGKLTFTPKSSYDTFHEQLVYMKQYFNILAERCKREIHDDV